MARIRTIKPEFFRHETLFEAERASGLPLRLAFAGMFTVADRDGRFRWSPRVLKLDVMPFDDVDFAAILDALAERGFIVRYEVGGEQYGHIPSWTKHQHINQRESKSAIPAPEEASARTCENIPAHGEGKGREGKGYSEPKGSGAAAPHVLEKELFDRGKQVLGKAAGGQIVRLLKAKGGSVPLARAAVEQAATKQNPGEFIGAIIRGALPPDPADAKVMVGL